MDDPRWGLQGSDGDSNAVDDTIETDTGALNAISRDRPFSLTTPYGLTPTTAPYYVAVPRELAQVKARHHLDLWAWRVVFRVLGADSQVMGLDILGPVILGRVSPRDPTVDIDFTQFNAIDKGVSRRHALIRPTEERLYLIDLSSTNGTRRNEVLLGAGIAVSLEDRDTVALGELTFEIRIVSRPDPSLHPFGPQTPNMDDTRPMQHGTEPPEKK